MFDAALPDVPAEKSRMSSATKPRKLDELDDWAPWPTSWMIGPCWEGVSFGLRGLKSHPTDAGVRGEVNVTEPRHDVSGVDRRSWKLCTSPSQLDAPTVGPGALM